MLGDVTVRARRARLLAYDSFVARWPVLEDWFAEPLSVRLDIHGDERQRRGVSLNAVGYLSYLSLAHQVPLDVPFTINRKLTSLNNDRLVASLGYDLGYERQLIERAGQLGYTRPQMRTSIRWILLRIAMLKGDPDITGLTMDDLQLMADEIQAFGVRPDAAVLRSLLARSTAKSPEQILEGFVLHGMNRLHLLHVVLFNEGSITAPPELGIRRRATWKDMLTPPGTPPVIKGVVERWLRLRLDTGAAAESTIQNEYASLGRLLSWRAAVRPEIESLDQLTREHIEEFLTYLAALINPRTKAPLAVQTRRGTVSALTAFFRETSRLGWEGVPERPLLASADLPKQVQSLPRFIPRDQLDQIMEIIESLECPFQRAALLLVRWTGARRSEIRRLDLDCLDAYPDDYPRLRIPVGKGLSERMVPLHPRAAEALGPIIDRTRAANFAPRYDETCRRMVRQVFIDHGKPLGNEYLFDAPLRRACEKLGLLDAAGLPQVSAHRFRHSVGTQLAEGGARLQTIMAILGHRSANMSMVYSRLSDPVVKQQYEQVIAGGGRIAGPAADRLLKHGLDEESVHWLKTNFFKTELELGHCLRLPQEGPCECDLYLRCSKFFTTSDYAPRLRQRLAVEAQLVRDATERGWPREVERHTAISRRLKELLAELGEPEQGELPACSPSFADQPS
ncbi:tyrosine-type recombinase/integrase [Streptosporangium canum]|uniref:tyrosine-type recombinase/integrase n=1 Tax=Streptosporangium canum TaxID=324952 RepID=UPI00367F8658